MPSANFCLDYHIIGGRGFCVMHCYWYTHEYECPYNYYLDQEENSD